MNPKTQKTETQTIAMLLPHELIHSVLKKNGARDLIASQQAALEHRPDLQLHQDRMRAWGMHPAETLLMGIWMDGVPFNSDRSKSLETLTLNLLCDKTMRLPLCVW